MRWLDFARDGLSTRDPLARKLWLASRILGGHAPGGPFGKALPDYTVAELDFVLEMAAQDDPDRYSFTRASGPPAAPTVLAKWSDTLMGNALMRYLERTGIASGQRALDAYRKRQAAGSGMRFGFTRGGKPIDAAPDKSNE